MLDVKYMFHSGLTFLLLTCSLLLMQLETCSGLEKYKSMVGLLSMSHCTPENQYLCDDARENGLSLAQDPFLLDRACIIDVGDSKELVNELILSFMERNVSDLTGYCWNQSPKTVFEPEENSIIFTYVSYELTRFISYLLISERILLVAVTFEQMFPSQLTEKYSNIYSHESSFLVENQGEINHRVTTELGLTYAGVIYVKEYAEDEKIIEQDCKTKERRNSAFCYFVGLDKHDHFRCYKEILLDYRNQTKANQTLDKVLKDPRMKFFFLYGFWKSYETVGNFSVFKGFEWQENNYFLSSFTRRYTNMSSGYNTSEEKYTRFQNIPGGHALQNFFKYFLQMEEQIIIGNVAILDVIRNIEEQYQRLLRLLIPGYKSGDSITQSDWLNIPLSVRQMIAKKVSSDDIIMENMIKAWKRMNYFKDKSGDDWKNSYKHNPSRVIQNNQLWCNLTIPTCGKGTELRHGLYHEKDWQNSYGYHCRVCLDKMYKDVVGNSNCKQCRYPNITDELRTKCFDPYTKEYLKIDNAIMLSVSCLSSITAFLIVLTFIIFIRLRETPMVKAANRPMTLVQLMSHFLLATVPQVLFLGEPTRWKCISRPIIVGLCFTATVSVNLAKTQKLHIIFSSKLVHTNRQRMAMGLLEWIITGIALLVNTAIMILLFYISQISVKDIYIKEHYIRQMTCSNNNQIIIQVFYVLVLVLANGIQAVRARHLPSHFKETTHVIYSSFTTVLLLGALSAIYFTQKSAKTRDVIMWASLLTMNFLHFSLIYAYKVYIMLFKSHKNTLEAFQAKRKSRINSKFSTMSVISTQTQSSVIKDR